jgi:peroxiredoxin (alkyl hydroperoxide reductase subunit C)
MPIQPGDKFPALTIKEATAEGPKEIDLGALFAGKKAVIFSVPGAFTPVCSKQHLPGYVAKMDELAAKGVEVVACLAVNDPHVMRAWGEAHGALGKIRMLADGNAAVTKALGIDQDFSAGLMGTRGKRAAITLEDGVVTHVDIEESPGKVDVSGADACLARF